MPQYRAFQMNGDRIAGPPYNLIADDDGAAVALARELVTSRCDIELWQLERFVIRLPRTDGPS
jgi:hypothetical protein